MERKTRSKVSEMIQVDCTGNGHTPVLSLPPIYAHTHTFTVTTKRKIQRDMDEMV